MILRLVCAPQCIIANPLHCYKKRYESSCRHFVQHSRSTFPLMRFTGIAIGGDSYPGSTLSDHCLRYQNIPQVGVPALWLTVLNNRLIVLNTVNISRLLYNLVPLSAARYTCISVDLPCKYKLFKCLQVLASLAISVCVSMHHMPTPLAHLATIYVPLCSRFWML